MKVTTFITQTMKAQKVTQTELAKRLGLKSQGVVSGRLHNGNITMENSIKMLDALDYDIYAVPRGYNKIQTVTAEPMKLTVHDEGDRLTADEMLLNALKAEMPDEDRAKFETQPHDVQLAIAKVACGALKNGITKAEA